MTTVYGMTKKFHMNRGVKQGDLLSPLLWYLFINPIVDHLLVDPALKTKVGERIGATAFVDDVVILRT